MKYGIEVLGNGIIEVANIAKDVKLSLPHIGMEDLGRAWDAAKQGSALAKTDWRELIAEAKDLDENERQSLAALVELKLQEMGWDTPNGAAITEHVLALMSDAILLAGDFTPKV